MRDKNIQTKRMTDEHVKIALTEIKKRRARWTLISIDFDDIIQIVMLRIIKKYHKYLFIKKTCFFSLVSLYFIDITFLSSTLSPQPLPLGGGMGWG